MARDRDARLAGGALRIEAALARDAKSCARETLIEMRGVEHELRAGADLRAEQCAQREAHPACGASSRFVAAILMGVRRHDVSEMRQRAIERADLVGRRALLWTEDGGSAVGSGQRVAHVARD